MSIMIAMGEKAKTSAKVLAGLLASQKDTALLNIATALEEGSDKIIAANALDMQLAKENNISQAMQDRLLLNKDRIKAMADAVRQVVALPDPVGVVLDGSTRPNGLEIIKKTVPLGVIGMIYESRPNVTIDSAVLCLKSGNACILRGGSEAIHSNKALADVLRSALEGSGVPKDSVQLIEDTSRERSGELMRLNKYIDALIPRGGQGLIRSVLENSTVPVIETGAGLCHIYVDDSADLDMALSIIDNAKRSRPSVCNAVETLLVHRAMADALLPRLKSLLDNVELRGCERALPLLGIGAVAATQQDWETEYNDYILAVKIVDSIEEAIAHIDKYSTQHSEVIISENYERSQQFVGAVDAATVYINASSRFTDGGEFGLGAEIGISNQKLHVRGPMGLTALTSYKYILRGNGQIR